MERNLHAEREGAVRVGFHGTVMVAVEGLYHCSCGLNRKRNMIFSSVICAGRTLDRQHNGEASCTITQKNKIEKIVNVPVCFNGT